MKSSIYFRIRGVAATAVFALSLATVTAATTDVIYSFEEDAGEYADTDLETDSAGNIYGTTVLGGDFGSGTVFQLSRTPDGWVHTVLYSFTGGVDGGEPYKGVTVDREGNLYGTAVTGGSGSCEGGCGVAYKLTNSGGTWTQTVIHAFTGGDDGSGPGARVTVDQAGNVYGMAPTGGANGLGTIYKIHQAQDGTWVLKVIHTFTGGADGSTGSAGRMILRQWPRSMARLPPAALMAAELFSSSRRRKSESGISRRFIHSEANRTGVFLMARCSSMLRVISMEPLITAGLIISALSTSWLLGLTANGGRGYSIASKGGTDGNSPISNLVFDRVGNLYGTTSEGGLGTGTIFKLSPVGGGQWMETVVHMFEGPQMARFPITGWLSIRLGNFYGATVHGGVDDDGSIYKFTP
jgi:uncharacterized repeat protein (TIGR03803 family)